MATLSRPRSAAAAVTIALCLGLSACGSSGSSAALPAPAATVQPSTGTPAPTVGDSASPSPGGAASPSGSTTMSLDLAKKLTAAGVLVAADLPGSKAAAQQDQQAQAGDEQGPEDALYKCLGLSAPKFLDRNPGTELSTDTPDVDVDSSAEVVDSAAAARDLAHAAQGSAGTGCYQTYFQSQFSADGDKLSGLTVTPVTVDVPGSDSAFAFHVVGATSGDDGGPFDTYFVTAGYGQTQITINYTAGGTGKASQADVVRLAGLVIGRVRGISA